MKMTMTKKKYNIIYDDNFKKDLKRLSGKHQLLVLTKLHRLEENPFYPSLRTKKLKGCKGCIDERFESSINMDIRVFWRFDSENIIIMLQVGHHDVLKQY